MTHSQERVVKKELKPSIYMQEGAFDALLVQTLKKNLEKAFPKMKARSILAEMLSKGNLNANMAGIR